MSPMEALEQREKERPKLEARAHLSVPNMGNTPPRMLLNEDAFVSMLYLERRRAERAQNRFVLILVDVQKVVNGISGKDRVVQMLAKSLSEATRETDIIGWYLDSSLMGVIGTELGKASNDVVQKRFLDKFRAIFESTLGIEKSASITASFHFFPEEYGSGANDHSANIKLYPEIRKREDARRVPLAIKRAIDVAGSAAAIAFLSPVFAAVALAIKFSSKGPVLFKQERLGQHGKTFTVLKFRSMRTDCDPKIHQQYVEQFIAGQVDGNSETAAKPVFKIQKDPRVTPIGRFIRKTSLDELPQFWNVLRGDMSLVGPRPALAYEFRKYEVWHRRRVLEIKPGITGLWQVEGRSRTRFDEMVRLDLKYARAWSVWLDLKILAQTPGAVIQGEGAH
ncbi:MAG TPA: exopolysaccharide biosynthesis polyprenyl glycosylphosphotransferase [Candidatus Acidoferrum sp.]|jgi:lipopolysaccharide/colanic/teichoic acid biosynthesis glycosyltransferase|nr:exopolysaccharide biosynthesis polyprenyl glycosylphosphotransferase [Candidatus Acidoferrum sp.]